MNAFAEGVKKEASLGFQLTDNGMVAYASSGSKCVDMFGTLGSARSMNRDTLTDIFSKAFAEDPVAAIILAFNLRDARGGMGERDAFLAIMKHLAKQHKRLVAELFPLFAEYGRYGDLVHFFEDELLATKAAEVMALAIINRDQLAAKWAPRRGDRAKVLRKAIGKLQGVNLSPRDYRKMIVALTDVVETKMCANQFDQINFNHVPSLAMRQYSKSFERQAADSFEKWQEGLAEGASKVNASVLMPHQVVFSDASDSLANAQWKALPDYFNGKPSSIFPMIDVSGSMMCTVGNNRNLTCMQVAIALGMYTSMNQSGPFKNLYLTFESNPNVGSIDDTKNIKDIANKIQRDSWGGSTNIAAALDRILNIAIKSNASADDMPKILIIFSDMHFDVIKLRDGNDAFMSAATMKFKAAGYDVPTIIFWNLNASDTMSHVAYDEAGVAKLSGFSPAMLKYVLAGDLDKLTPVSLMNDVINNERYAPVLTVLSNIFSSN